MKVVAALDKFRGTLGAQAGCRAVAAAVTAAGGECVQRPMSDGGEGMLAAFGGELRSSTVAGPLGAPVTANWLLRSDGLAVIESAQACGLEQAGGAEGNDPVAASTAGVGQLLVEAVRAGCNRVLVGLGGSATTDGGSGALEAIEDGLRAGLPVPVQVCCDVRTTFVDAARVFGPQKGASQEQVALLTDRLADLRERYLVRYGLDVGPVPGSGAAGGLAGGLWCAGAELVGGFDRISAEVGLPAQLTDCDLVVTGEGFFDSGSLAGKVVGGVIELARRSQVPVLVVAGGVEQGMPTFDQVQVVSLTEQFGFAAASSDTAECVRLAIAGHLSQQDTLRA
jgi:glycerate kinase